MENRMSLLNPEEKDRLEALALNSPNPALRRRALILLGYHEGYPTRQVAEQVSMSPGRTRYWRRQFLVRGMEIFIPRRRTGLAKASPASVEQPVKGEERLDDTPASLPGEAGGSPAITSPVEGSNPVQTEPVPPAREPDSTPPLKKRRKKKSKAKMESSLQPEQAEPEVVLLAEGQPAIFEELEAVDFEAYLEESPGGVLPFPAPLPEPGLQHGDTLAEAGRKTLLYHFAEMLRHEEGTRLGEDIEELHDMRVATRRMRAAFDLFEQAFDPKVIRRHLKGLRATGRALGAVRDMDVFIEKADIYMQDLSPEGRQGLEVLVEAWEAQRETAREAMLVHLDSPDYAAFKDKFNKFVQTPGKGIRLLSDTCPVPPMARDAAPVLIYSRFSAVRAYEQLLETATLEQLHALRIEFKKLRYAVEFFREILGKEAKSVITVLKTMQDHLGDLNDAQVATQLLSDFLARMEFSHLDLPLSERRNPEPVVVYLAAKHAERHRLMRTFPAAWQVFNQPEFRQNLALAVAAL